MTELVRSLVSSYWFARQYGDGRKFVWMTGIAPAARPESGVWFPTSW